MLIFTRRLCVNNCVRETDSEVNAFDITTKKPLIGCQNLLIQPS